MASGPYFSSSSSAAPSKESTPVSSAPLVGDTQMDVRLESGGVMLEAKHRMKSLMYSAEERNKKAIELKEEGNAHFHAGRFEKAIPLFDQAIEWEPTNSVLFSNRSAAYAGLQRYDIALTDAELCIDLDPVWMKGYLRQAIALRGLARFDDALRAYMLCYGNNPSHPDFLAAEKSVEADRAAYLRSRDQAAQAMKRRDPAAAIKCFEKFPMCGTLFKMSKVKFYKTWAVLRGTALSYYKDRDVQPSQTLNLIGATVQLSGDAKTTCDFTINGPHLERLFFFRTPTSELRELWVQALQVAMGHATVQTLKKEAAATAEAEKNRPAPAPKLPYNRPAVLPAAHDMYAPLPEPAKPNAIKGPGILAPQPQAYPGASVTNPYIAILPNPNHGPNAGGARGYSATSSPPKAASGSTVVAPQPAAPRTAFRPSNAHQNVHLPLPGSTATRKPTTMQCAY